MKNYSYIMLVIISHHITDWLLDLKKNCFDSSFNYQSTQTRLKMLL